MRIAIIGAGNVGGGLGAAFAAVGHSVVLASPLAGRAGMIGYRSGDGGERNRGRRSASGRDSG